MTPVELIRAPLRVASTTSTTTTILLPSLPLPALAPNNLGNPSRCLPGPKSTRADEEPPEPTRTSLSRHGPTRTPGWDPEPTTTQVSGGRQASEWGDGAASERDANDEGKQREGQRASPGPQVCFFL